MEFTPHDGFCCPLVEKSPSKSEYEPRILKFMTWVKLLPVQPDRSKRCDSASTVAPLKDQPFVIKIVEEGYAFMFQGAFAPRQGEGDTGGFDRISYFDLITSDFEETRFDGRASEVIVCDVHKKRFLLGLYLKAPSVMDPWPKELRMRTSGLKYLDNSCGDQENDGVGLIVTTPVVTSRRNGADAVSSVNTELIPKFHRGHKSQEQLTAGQSDNDTWTWL